MNSRAHAFLSASFSFESVYFMISKLTRLAIIYLNNYPSIEQNFIQKFSIYIENQSMITS